MQRAVFTMKLKPGCAAEYRKRHREIWPELLEALRNAGMRSYGIYLEELTGTLFAVQELADNHTMAELPQQEIMQRWWAHMADLIDTNAYNSPLCRPLEPVFHMGHEPPPQRAE